MLLDTCRTIGIFYFKQKLNFTKQKIYIPETVNATG